MGWKDNILNVVEWPAKFLANGAHAQQDIPAQHRILNAGIMFGGWAGLDQLRHIAFGWKMKSEGEYVEVKREDVPLPLRFLHKSIDWDPHSETSEHQWKKLAYQLMPGVGAGLGAVAGSMYAFERNGRAQNFAKLKGADTLNLLDADFVSQYAQSGPLRALTAFFGTFSAASGLTAVYGLFLNSSFLSANGARMFTGKLAKGNLAPHRAVEAQLGMIGSYAKQARASGSEISEEWAHQFVDRVLQPLFGHELKTPEAQEQARQTLQRIVSDSYHRALTSGVTPDAIAKAVTDDLSKTLNKSGLDETLRQQFGLDPAHAKLGNANSALRGFQDFLQSIGLARNVQAGKQPDHTVSPLRRYAIPAIGGAAGIAAGIGLTAKPAAAKSLTPGKKNKPNASGIILKEHTHPNATGMTAQEYAYEAMRMHQEQYKEQGMGPPALLKWIGDAQLAVLPENRLDCAIGLTGGLMVAGNMAKIATGYGLDGKAVDASKIPTYLQKLHGIVKDYNPKGLRARDRWIKYAQTAIYSAGGLIGVKLGTDFAYRRVKQKNKDPHYLEDYLPRVSMHQGDSWSWLAATSGVFGSASGLFTAPIPGLNYGISLAARSTSMQDRNFMLSGVNEWMSGAKTTSFLRLREGVNYLCHYAVDNPSENPAQLEFLTYTLLAPLFKEQLTVEHIQQFTDAVHYIRDQFWQEGGIPKEKRKEALKTMREVFTGPGLEIMLINMGLNPGTIVFDKLNGISGKIGNTLGAERNVLAEQEAYDKALTERLAIYVKEGFLTQERADWVKTGIAARQRGEALPAPAPAAHPDSQSVLPVHSAEPVAAEKPAFSERIQPKRPIRTQPKQPIKTLLERAESPGDWRDEAQLRRQRNAPALVVE